MGTRHCVVTRGPVCVTGAQAAEGHVSGVLVDERKRGGGGAGERRGGGLWAVTCTRSQAPCRTAPTCLTFSRCSAALPAPLMCRLFLYMAMRVLPSLLWILGSRAFSCCCRAFSCSTMRWLYRCICSRSCGTDSGAAVSCAPGAGVSPRATRGREPRVLGGARLRPFICCPVTFSALAWKTGANTLDPCKRPLGPLVGSGAGHHCQRLKAKRTLKRMVPLDGRCQSTFFKILI